VPRALLYYEYFPFWKGFLESLECEVVLSGPTTAKTLEAGTRLAGGQACLPVRLFYGHVAELVERVEVLWVPRVISVERKEYHCPNFPDLSDLVQHVQGARAIGTTVDLSKGGGRFYRAACAAGRCLGASTCRSLSAAHQGLAAHRRFQSQLAAGFTVGEVLGETSTGRSGCLASGDGHRVAVLGQPYIVHDARAGLGILPYLRRRGYQVFTAEVLPPPAVAEHASRLSRTVSGTYEKRILGSAHYLLKHGLVDGIIRLVASGCGPGSLVGELIEREVAGSRKVPYLILSADEPPGEAGVMTRLEAFLDLLDREIEWAAGQ
jgi:predicted nucleotide-binding protein (sugar kinase/HSP70/actin superfamily)